MYYAHSTGGDMIQWQRLSDHLNNTAKLAEKLGERFGIGQYACLAALLHDIGKYSQEFQQRLLGDKRRVDHSTAGAQEVLHLLQDTPAGKVVGSLLSYCIAGHHSGLPDYGSPYDLESDGTWNARLKKRVADFSDYRREIETTHLSLPKILPIKPTTAKGSFTLSFLARMIYSVLVDADYMETEAFVRSGTSPRGQFDDIDKLFERLNSHLRRFKNPTTHLNKQRTETLKQAIEKAKSKQGIFTLTVPTGGGKTLSSLAFALSHARQHHLDRIIYVIPYTTIIEQNAAVFKQCLGEGNILEHHSNFDWENRCKDALSADPDDETLNAFNKLKLSAENWDVPVIVTTNVQFFESLFSNRSSQCRKIHNIANSIVIFDEAQMLPRSFLEPCMKAVYELVRNYQSTAVFCTATQPILNRFFPNSIAFEEIGKDPMQQYQVFKRTRIIDDGKQSNETIASALDKHEQVLCIVNTKRHAKELFQKLQPEGRYHLSTLMCAAHRKKVIEEIRRCLIYRQTCRVISTQIMEAGIDIDFPIGYRALAGLDSIIQAAGRVNREGKLPCGDLHIFEPEVEFARRTPAWIAQAAAVTKNILRQYREDPICPDAIRSYYEALYSIQDTSAFDEKHIMDHFEQGNPGDIEFRFRSAARDFRLIDEQSGLIIPFEMTPQQIIDDQISQSEPYRFLRKYQLFTVNLYKKDFDHLDRKGVIHYINDRFPVLMDLDYYDPETGLALPDSEGSKVVPHDG